jgi:hypothetical protein
METYGHALTAYLVWGFWMVKFGLGNDGEKNGQRQM